MPSREKCGAPGEEASVVSTMGTQATVERLKAVDLLANCTDAQLQDVAHLAERVQVGEGEVLAREGRIGREFFLILSGSVAVTQRGRRVNTLGPGDFFGELAAMDPGPRNATVTALCDLDVLIIGPREFSAMADIPGFRDALFRSMASRLRTAEARLAAALDTPDTGWHLGKASPGN
jgi:CRP/FNR family cyclic AMP-dependent transcriptional regulator